MEALPIGRKILQKPLEATGSEMELGDIFRDIGEAEAAESRLKNVVDRVEDELPVHPNLDLAAVLFELPGIKTAIGGQAQMMRLCCIRSFGCLGISREAK